MNVLVLGSGGREHALAWKIDQSELLNKLYCAPGNAGTQNVAENVALPLNDFDTIANFCLEQSIDLVVVGPEAPLVEGIVDFFHQSESLKHISIIGPDKNAAQLEGSKNFCKEFMQRHDIPTAAYKTFISGQLEEATAFLSSLQAPYVLKADGLAAGKGVLILDDLNQAIDELKQMWQGKFGEAGKAVVIEEFLDGREFSVFALTDGKDYKILPVAKDYKRIGEGDTGKNTGGMGAVSPVSFCTEALMEMVEERIVKPTISGLEKENFDYRGFVFFGLIEVKGEPKVIEYNVRMGDPETEVVMPRLKSDVLAHLLASAKSELAKEQIEIYPEFATTVMAVSGGYPDAYEKGKKIEGLDQIEGATVFHAGTKADGKEILTSGGRVLAATGLAKTKEEALNKSYNALKKICFDGIFYRKDIGQDV